MTTTLPDKPQVRKISELTGLDVFGVVGRLHAVWSWADTHCGDCNAASVTDSSLDGLTSHAGFAKAMREVGWLAGDNWHLSFPAYEQHNGPTAKRKALTAKRNIALRARRQAQKRDAGCVTGTHEVRDARVTLDASRSSLESDNQSDKAGVTQGALRDASVTQRASRSSLESDNQPDSASVTQDDAASPPALSGRSLPPRPTDEPARARERIKRPTLAQAKSVTGQVGVTVADAEAWWNDRESTDWIRPTAAGGTIAVGTNWQADLKTYTNRKKEGYGSAAKSQPGRGTGRKTHLNRSGEGNAAAVARGEYD
jgi:hypothetical protein